MQYLKRILEKTFEPVFRWADSIATLGPIFLALLSDGSMADLQIKEYITSLLAALVIARFVVAPYFVWKDDQEKILALNRQIDLLSSRKKQTIDERVAKLKLDLAEAVGQLLTAANSFADDYRSTLEFTRSNLSSEFSSAYRQTKQLCNSLASDDAIFRQCQEVLNLSANVVEETKAGAPIVSELRELRAEVQALQKRLRLVD